MTKYICIKPLRQDWLITITNSNYFHIGDIIEVDFEDELSAYQGAYTIYIYINEKRYRGSIHRLDIDHFISLNTF